MNHIRRTSIVPTTVGALKSILRSVSPQQSFRVTFKKKDGRVRVMDVAYDPQLASIVAGNDAAVEKRRETNRDRNNLVVRERKVDGKFQWRTIPVGSILSIAPCK